MRFYYSLGEVDPSYLGNFDTFFDAERALRSMMNSNDGAAQLLLRGATLPCAVQEKFKVIKVVSPVVVNRRKGTVQLLDWSPFEVAR